MEKVKVFNGSKLEPVNKEKRDIMAEKIDSLWGNRCIRQRSNPNMKIRN